MTEQRLYRSRRDRMIGGVAGGIAEYARIDPTLVRIGWVILALLTQGAAVLVYILLLFVVPEGEGVVAASSVATADGTEAGAGAAGVADVSPAADSRPVATQSRPSSTDDGRTAGLVFGAVLVVVGAWFLLRQYLPAIDWSLSWPVIAIIGGIVLLAAAMRAGDRPGGRSG
ncbi:MAG TPA: PspC domain-containing protein [Candidatus Limnocylindrales bacterium]|jgi:phage shock protein PspC (stress-responsive transcriptional regulator)